MRFALSIVGLLLQAAACISYASTVQLIANDVVFSVNAGVANRLSVDAQRNTLWYDASFMVTDSSNKVGFVGTDPFPDYWSNPAVRLDIHVEARDAARGLASLLALIDAQFSLSGGHANYDGGAGIARNELLIADSGPIVSFAETRFDALTEVSGQTSALHLLSPSVQAIDVTAYVSIESFLSIIRSKGDGAMSVVGTVERFGIELQVLGPVPEPAGWLTMITGLGLIGWRAKARSKASSSPATEIVSDTSLAQ